MAYFVQVVTRHNLSKACSITNKLIDIKLLSKQHIRHLPRWSHRRPIRVIYGEDLSNDQVNYEKKLKIERESIQSLTKDQEDLLENADMTVKDKETVIDITKSVNTSFYKSTANVNYDTKHTKLESKLHSTWYHVSDEPKVSEVEKSQKSNLQSNTRKGRKLEAKLERKTIKVKESAVRAGVPVYTKLQDNDPKLSNAMLIAKSKNRKKKRSLIVLEGKILIKDAIEAGYVPQMVFFSRVKDAGDLHLPDGVQLYKISYKSISLWSDVTTSPGILGILETPSVDKKKPGKDALPLTIICDNIRDPGNLGTILRAAAGVGCQKVILTKGCVDLWEPKVLRSGAGAHFRTAIVSDVEWNEIERHVDSEASVFLADNSGQILDDIQEKEEEEENVDNSNELIRGDEENVEISESMMYKNRLSSIPVIPYFAVDYVNQISVILIIGGETEGLSIDAFRLASDRCGVRLNVPLSNNVESLNSGTALGIIVFEIKRQFLSKFHLKVGERSEDMEKIHVPNV